MARSLSQTLTLSRHLSPKSAQIQASPPSSSLLVSLRTQSNLPSSHGGDLSDLSDASSSASSDPLLRKLEDAIHRIIVRKSAPDWLPFLPGSSYWVPPPRSRNYGLNHLVEKLANPLTQEESMSTTTLRGWPSSDYFIHGPFPFILVSIFPLYIFNFAIIQLL